jgi:hypothetical protein
MVCYPDYTGRYGVKLISKNMSVAHSESLAIQRAHVINREIEVALIARDVREN